MERNNNSNRNSQLEKLEDHDDDDDHHICASHVDFNFENSFFYKNIFLIFILVKSTTFSLFLSTTLKQKS